MGLELVTDDIVDCPNKESGVQMGKLMNPNKVRGISKYG